MCHTEKLKITCPGCGQKLDVSEVSPFEKISCPACGQEVLVPKRFGELMLEEPLGEGLSGASYRALDLTLDREVAVKVFHARFGRDGAVAKAMLEVTRRVAKLNHPNVVPIFSCARDGDEPFVVCEYLAGGSLLSRLQPGAPRIPLRAMLRMMRDVVKGVAAAAHEGIAHGGISAANILFDADGKIKVGDFGLAATVLGAEGAGELSWPGAYAVSPELLRGEVGPGVGSDVFSLGAVFYHGIAGQPPWAGATLAEIKVVRKQGAPAPLPAVRSGVPASLETLVRSMLDPFPEKRPKTYGEILAAINQILAIDLDSTAAEMESPGQGGSPKANRKMRLERPLPVVRPGRRRARDPRGRWFNLAFVVGCALCLAALVLGARRRAPWYRRSVGRATAQLGRLWQRMLRKRSERLGVPGRGSSRAAGSREGPKSGGTVAGGEESRKNGAPSGGGASRGESLLPPGPGTARRAAGKGEPSRPGASARPRSSTEPRQAGAPGPPEPLPAGARPGSHAKPETPVREPSGAGTPAKSAENAAGRAPARTPKAAGNRPPGSGSRPRLDGPLRVRAVEERPRPPDLDFSRVEREIDAYLAKQAPAARALEEKRLAMLRGCRENLMELMKYMPYADTKAGILLRDGRRIPGSIPLCNDRGIVIRSRRAHRPVIVAWDQIALPQYLAFFEHYAELRLHQAGSEADRRVPGNGTAANRREAAKDYFRLAVLCDWYGLPEAAQKYSGRVAELAPELAARLRRFIPTRSVDNRR